MININRINKIFKKIGGIIVGLRYLIVLIFAMVLVLGFTGLEKIRTEAGWDKWLLDNSDLKMAEDEFKGDFRQQRLCGGPGGAGKPVRPGEPRPDPETWEKSLRTRSPLPTISCPSQTANSPWAGRGGSKSLTRCPTPYQRIRPCLPPSGSSFWPKRFLKKQAYLC